MGFAPPIPELTRDASKRSIVAWRREKVFLLGLMLGLGFVPAAVAASEESSFASLPAWYSHGASSKIEPFGSAAYLAMAVDLQGVGKVEAVRLLRQWSGRADGNKVIPLCRMLFQAKPGQSFRAPKLGWGGAAPREDKADWPLDPIALEQGVPFLVSPRYGKVEQPETALEYLAYCEAECEWATLVYERASPERLAAACEALCARIGGTRQGTWKLYFKAQTR